MTAVAPPMAEMFLGIPGLTPGSVGIMGMLAMILGTIVVTLIKQWPALAVQASNARAALRAEARTDLDDCRERLDQFEKRLEAAESRFHSAEIQVVTIVSAYSIVDTELEHSAPGSIGLAQARRMLRAAFPNAESVPAHMKDLLKQFTGDPPPATKTAA